MEAICVKLDERILKNVDNSLKQHNFSTRTDFVREAIRDKLRILEKEKAIRQLEKYFGAAKVKVSNKRHKEIREEVLKERMKKLGI